MTNKGSHIVEKHARKHAQSTTFRLFVEASLFRLTGWFHIHLFLFIYASIAVTMNLVIRNLFIVTFLSFTIPVLLCQAMWSGNRD